MPRFQHTAGMSGKRQCSDAEEPGLEIRESALFLPFVYG
jgi:hypothetical protein